MAHVDDTGIPRRRPSPFVALLVVLCIALGVVEVALVLRNRALSARVTELSRALRADRPPAAPALEGRPFPARVLLDTEGGELDLTAIPEGHGTLLFVSSSACDYCELARPAWERAARDLAGSPIRVLELVLDATPPELASHAATYPVLGA